MFNYFDHLLFRGDHQHKAAGLKIKLSKTTITTVSSVLWKMTTFVLEHYKPLEESMVSLMFSVTVAMCLQISWTS